MWFVGALITVSGIGMVALGGVAALKGDGARAHWALGRGSVTLVVGMLMFLGVPAFDGRGITFDSLATVVMVAAAVAALVVLMLGEESVTHGRNMTTFVTRPARHGRTTRMEELERKDKPVSTPNVPSDLHPAMESARGDGELV